MKALEDYIENLKIGQGRHSGQNFRLLGWQKKFIRRAFGQDGDAALSLGRGNGKSTLIAAIACATVDVGGPLVEPNSESIVIASSFSQGLIVFRHILHFLFPALAFRGKRFRVLDTVNSASVTDRKTGAMLRVIGSDPRRAHGLAPRLLLYDEVAQWEPSKIDPMLAALKTSRGKIPNSKAIWIGTRADTPGHPFEKALQGGVGYSQSHFARKQDPPFRRSTWLRANPSLPHMPDLAKTLKLEAADAKRDPSALQTFRALRLNQGVPLILESLLLDADAWARVEVDDESPLAGRYVLGIDLGQNAAMSACAGYWPESGRLEALAAFPQIPGLRERGLADGVGRLYMEMASRGEILISGRRVSDISILLTEALERWGRPGVIVCDRWREAELREKLEALHFPQAELCVRGQGFRDGGEDVRLFREAVLQDRVRPAKSLLLRAAMGEARTVMDPAGNAKLSKKTEGGRRANARDDAAAAAILAVSEGVRRSGRTQRTRPRRMLVV